MSRLLFLGTGGGRWSSIFQERATGGFRLELEHDQIHIDPGPGAIVRCKEHGVNPRDTTAVICSHDHLDHQSDAEILVEAMCMGNHAGVFLGSSTVLEGSEIFDPALDSYHRTLLSDMVILRDGSEYKLPDCTLKTHILKHTDPSNVGIIFDTNQGKIGYISDTEYFPELPGIFQDCKFLVISLMRPGTFKIPGHLCTRDAIKLLNDLNPQKAIFTHFGLKMLRADPQTEIEKIASETGKSCIAASDGLSVPLLDQKDLGDY